MKTDHHAGGADRFDADLDALTELLDAGALDEGAIAPIAPRPAGAAVPMSFAQELLWLLDRATPGMTAYNLPIGRRLRGPLDVPALERALTTLVARHEALRTRLAEVDGEPRQLVDPPAPVALRVVDLGALPAAEREQEARRVVGERARTPFDMAHEHLFRATLVRLAADNHVLVLESHHIVLDGWSLGIVLTELATAYTAERAGRSPALPAQKIQYGDFAIWQRQRLSGERLDRLLAFWRAQLGDATEPLALPSDHPRAAVATFTGARESVLLPADTLSRVKRLAQAHDVTLYMVLLAAYATVFHRYTGRENVLVGSGSAGRTEREMESVVGYLNNTLVQRADFSRDPTVAELLARVRASTLDAYDHQDIPLEKLVLELREGEARLSPAPLFEVVLTMQDALPSSFAMDGLAVEPFGADVGATKFDITLFPMERDGQLWLTAQYRSDLFEPATMRRFLGHLSQVLDAFVSDAGTRVSALPLLTPGESAELVAWNDSTADLGAASTITALVEAAVDRASSHDAVVDEHGTLTYAELESRANQLAHYLRTLGVGPDVVVGLGIERSREALVAMLGILKAGGAYVPIMPDLPRARVAQVVEESAASIVVTLAAHTGVLPATATVVCLDRDAADLAGEPTDRPTPLATPSSLAYVLFTSGSTGTPKGVAVTHANLVQYCRAISARLGLSLGAERAAAPRHFAMVSTLAADLGLTSLFPALVTGGTLHVLPSAVSTDPARFAEYVAAHPIDVLKITPGHLRALAGERTGAALADLLPTQWLVLGGEALSWELAERLLGAARPRVLNHYGPTESTVGVCTFEVTRDSAEAARRAGAATVPIGSPIANARLHVLDAAGRSAPVGIPGELYVGGPGVAQGYLNRSDLTAERFTRRAVDDGIAERLYRTGDRARRLPDGSVEFLGRVDDQVKVRGYRVELGEVEAVLARHPSVDRAVVVLRVDEGVDRLVGYVTPKSGGYTASHVDRPTSEGLTEWVGAELPAFMVPAAIVILDALPLTPNGKVDRTSLPAPEMATAAATYVEPATPTETAIAVIWQDVLKRERVGSTDNFLDLGGHSLLAIRVLGRISKQFGLRLALRTLFDAPTVASLAAVIDAERAIGAPKDVGIGARSRDAFRIGQPAPNGGSDGGLGGASR